MHPTTRNRTLEDPLAYLPCSMIYAYPKGQTIYDQNLLSTNLYLVIDGKVKVGHLAENGGQIVVDIYVPDEFFGESSLLRSSHGRREIAVAMEPTTVMAWTNAAIEDLVADRPKLALALIQLFAQRSTDLVQRIESFSGDTIARRLALALLRFAERMGSEDEAGSVQMIPLTHELLAQYIGTSRELVTQSMNQFRRDGYLRHSRRGISLHPEKLRDWLASERSERSGRIAGELASVPRLSITSKGSLPQGRDVWLSKRRA